MSYEHGTPHYNLPQTVGSDTRDWFDTNEAFADIDAAIYSASQTAETAAQDLDGVKSDVQGLKDADIAMTSRVDGIEGRVGASEQAIGRLEQEVADVDTDLMDAICAIKEASATAAYQHLTGTFFWYNDTLYKAIADIGVGNQIVPDTNCTTTNITTELLSGGGEVIDSYARAEIAEIQENMGTLEFRVDGGNAQYSKDGGSTWTNFKNPVGTRSITANGTYDVTDYASVSVNVSASTPTQTLTIKGSERNKSMTLDHDTDVIYFCSSYGFNTAVMTVAINGTVQSAYDDYIIHTDVSPNYGLYVYTFRGTYPAGTVITLNSTQSADTMGSCVIA